jgi:hypothetical protein
MVGDYSLVLEFSVVHELGGVLAVLFVLVIYV